MYDVLKQVVFFRYLSTGMAFEQIAQAFFMDHYTVGLIVDETCKKIYEKLSPEHLAVPSPDDFKKIAANYELLWQFPNCIGELNHYRLRSDFFVKYDPIY